MAGFLFFRGPPAPQSPERQCLPRPTEVLLQGTIEAPAWRVPNAGSCQRTSARTSCRSCASPVERCDGALCSDGEQPRPTGHLRRTRCRPHGRLYLRGTLPGEHPETTKRWRRSRAAPRFLARHCPLLGISLAAELGERTTRAPAALVL